MRRLSASLVSIRSRCALWLGIGEGSGLGDDRFLDVLAWLVEGSIILSR